MNPYPSAILNELHHYFPELLYRSERFETVQDVLRYVSDVAAVNRFEQERAQYRRSVAPPLQEDGKEQSANEEQDGKEQDGKEEQELDSNNQYNYTASSSAYSTPSPVTPPSSSSPSSSSPSSSSPSSEESPNLQAEDLIRALFRRSRISSIPASRPSTNRFRLSVPLNLSSFLSSTYSSPAPSALQGLSQLQDLLQPVVIRPTERHLAENTYMYRSEIPMNDNCSICQDPMEAGQETRTILACSHCFHRECIDRWFQEHVQCPTCRHDVRDA